MAVIFRDNRFKLPIRLSLKADIIASCTNILTPDDDFSCLLADIALIAVKVLRQFSCTSTFLKTHICQCFNERILILNLRLDTGKM
jgi:hypothetical protein